jgi:diguanylate cyclase (GGDEF)-like protein/PAS domain S-box-containing protein
MNSSETTAPADHAAGATSIGYREFLAAVPLPAVVHDSDGRIVHGNDEFARLLGYEPDSLPGMAAADVVHPEELAARTELAGRLLSGELERAQTTRRLVRRDGKVVTARVSKIAMQLDGRRRVVVFVEDSGEKVEELARLRFAVEHDGLTGLLSRTGMTAHLTEMFRRGALFEVAMVDVDGLKTINDGFGHSVGDRLLRRVAALLRVCTPRNAALSRWSGDEFVVAAPPAAGATLLGALSTGLQVMVDLGTGVPHRLSASVGVAWCGNGRTPSEALAMADVAMYDVKHRRPGSRPVVPRSRRSTDGVAGPTQLHIPPDDDRPGRHRRDIS